jgi:sterol desaturase/sphingolipid hydroxylase (fatty acid hydroxylase superfamily)
MPALRVALGMIILLFAIAAGCILVERLWPAMELPQVHAWWARVFLINGLQLGIVLLAGETWNRWLAHASLLHLSDHLNDFSAAGIAYFISTFVYYWWHRFRHESHFFWRLCHQLHHSPRRIEILTSFYKHPVEILLNSLLSSAIVYTLLGCNMQAAAYYTFLTAIAEYFYHWNIKTPRWFGYLVQRPESHRVHHQYRHHTQNFADLPIWDWLFGTLRNPRTFSEKCGFDVRREDQFEDLLAFRDVHATNDKQERQPLHFLPTCIGCRKRWACAAAQQEALS